MTTKGWQIAICVFLASSLQASEELDWLSDWFDIEIIVFQQPPEIAQAKDQKEQLLIERPAFFSQSADSFALREDERTQRLKSSPEVDLLSGDQEWFFGNSTSNSWSGPLYATSQANQFPDWLLPPGESYHPFLIEVFDPFPFGSWYTLEFLDLVEPDTEEVEQLEETDSDLIEIQKSEEQLALEAFQAAHEQFKAQIESTAFVPNYSTVRLIRTKQRLLDNQYAVISHFHWHQPAAGLNSGKKVLLIVDDPTQIEGYLGLEQGRFLHFLTHLWMENEETDLDLTGTLVYEINERRRVLLNEVNYFDHPKFGALVEIQRLRAPVELVRLLESIQ